MSDGSPSLPEGAAGAPTSPATGRGHGGPWWRQRNAIIAFAGLIIVIVIIVVVTSGGSSNGWTPAQEAATLRACEDSSGINTQGCQCAVRWIEAHMTPAQAQAGGQALGEVLAGQVIAACPSLVGG